MLVFEAGSRLVAAGTGVGIGIRVARIATPVICVRASNFDDKLDGLIRRGIVRITDIDVEDFFINSLGVCGNKSLVVSSILVKNVLIRAITLNNKRAVLALDLLHQAALGFSGRGGAFNCEEGKFGLITVVSISNDFLRVE